MTDYNNYIDDDSCGSGHHHGDTAPCDLDCGGDMTWCGTCQCWTHTCCHDYGTCMCS